MLIVALVLAVVGLAALVTAVVTSNELVAWVCIGASVLGVILLIVDAIRERGHVDRADATGDGPPPDAGDDGEAIDQTYKNFDAEYPDEDESSVPAADETAGQTETLEPVSAEQAGSDQPGNDETPPTARPDAG
jgi:hypothetical protein